MKCIDQLIHNEYLFSTLKASLLKEKSMNEHFSVNTFKCLECTGTCILFSVDIGFMVLPNKKIFFVKYHFC